MINSDSYYEIGAGHIFCEDYATSGQIIHNNSTYHYAVVSDGCSSSKDSDIGSRWLARNFPKAVKLALTHPKEEFQSRVQEFLVSSLQQGMEQFSAPLNTFDATLVAIVYDRLNDELHSFAWGDGKIFYKYRNDETGYLTDIGYVSNAPYYLTYRQDIEREMRYEAYFGKLYADILGYVVKPDGVVFLPETAKSFQRFHYEKFPAVSSTLSFASVFTDGIDTFHMKGDVDIQMAKHNIYNQLTQYKNFHGEFVKRRMQKVKSFCQKEGWQHFDDIAVATISF